MDSLFYRIATRRLSGRGPVPPDKLDANYLDSFVRRTKLIRKGLLSVLIVIALGTFIEIVLMPGALIRTTFHAPPSTPEEAGTDIPPLAPDVLFMSESERHRQDELRRQRIEARIRSTHEGLGMAITAAQTELQRVQKELASKLNGSAEPGSHIGVPLALLPILSQHSTAQLAWSDLVTTLTDADSAIATGLSLHRLGAERLAANSYLPEDEREFSRTAELLRAVASRLGATRSDMHHLQILLQAHAAASRQPQDIQSTGGFQ